MRDEYIPDDRIDHHDYDDNEPFGSCLECGANLDDDLDDLCDQCQWWIEQANTEDDDMSDKGTERDPNDFGEPWKLDEEGGWIRDRDEEVVFDLIHVPEPIQKEVVVRFNALQDLNLSEPDKETELILRLIRAKRENNEAIFAMTLDHLFELRMLTPMKSISLMELHELEELKKENMELKAQNKALTEALQSRIDQRDFVVTDHFQIATEKKFIKG